MHSGLPMQIDAPRHNLHPLPYAEAEPPRNPSRLRVIGTVSLLVGLLGLPLNAVIALLMFKQLFKQFSGRGASRLPLEPWLLATGTGATLSAVLAVGLCIAGLVTICNPAAARAPHRWYAWLKLPLAVVFAACAGAYVAYFVSREPQVIGAAAALAVIVSAGYPVFLLRTFRSQRLRHLA